MPTERQTDFIIAELLKSAGINFFPNGSNIFEIQNALATYSKFKFQKKLSRSVVQVQIIKKF